MKKFASVYSIFVGLSMIAMWVMFYVTGGIPEINTRPAEIGLHMIAETLTALLLIAGGVGMVKNIVYKKYISEKGCEIHE